MHVGVFVFPTEYAIRVDELGRALEERGFESLFLPEHTHIPLSRRTPFPGGGTLPREYSHTLDPFVALTAAGFASFRSAISPRSARSRASSAKAARRASSFHRLYSSCRAV